MDGYLKGTDIEKFTNILEHFVNKELGYITRLRDSSVNITGSTISIIDEVFEMNNIQNLGGDFKLLYNSLNNTVSYSGFCNVLSAIFTSNSIVINYNSSGQLIVNVTSGNPNLYASYIDNEGKSYVDAFGYTYIGFKAGEWASLKTFLSKFLQKYLPAGRTLAELNIALKVATKN